MNLDRRAANTIKDTTGSRSSQKNRHTMRTLITRTFMTSKSNTKHKTHTTSTTEWVDELLGRIFSVANNYVFDHERIGVTIPAPMFRKLIALCHPDKHHNSEMSQEVTRWLIDQREMSLKTSR